MLNNGSRRRRVAVNLHEESVTEMSGPSAAGGMGDATIRGWQAHAG